jgi:hypothetical protein
MSRVGDVCSDTEFTTVSAPVKRGFATLRYLKLGMLIMPEDTTEIPAIIVPAKNAKA